MNNENLVLDADARWYWDHFREIIDNRLCEHTQSSSGHSVFRAVENRPQPKEWTLEEYNPSPERGLNSELSAAEETNADCCDCNFTGEWKPVETLAWYVPELVATNKKNQKFGIHFCKAKMESAFNEIDFGNVDEWFSKCAFIQTVFAHEACHAWIEALVNHSYYFNGSTNPLVTMKSILSQYGGYIAVEEAICNTAAFGWATWFTARAVEDGVISQPQGDAFLKAIKQWMRGQPRGYCDFKDSGELPIRSHEFLSDISKLLKKIYHVPKSEAAVGSFFNAYRRGGFHSKLPSILPRVLDPIKSDTSGNLSGCPLWRIKTVPTYWHDDVRCYVSTDTHETFDDLLSST